MNRLNPLLRKLRRWLKWTVIALFGIIAVAALAGMAYQFFASELAKKNYLAPGKLIDVGGYRLHFSCSGDGSPTVLMDTGIVADGLLTWGLVQPEISEFTRICTYDRAGYGWSDAGPIPRTSGQIVKELRTLLDNAQILPPYLLVGHSFGGLNVLLFASQYCEEVAGIILVDSAHPDQRSRFRKAGVALPPEDLMARILIWTAPFGLPRLFMPSRGPASDMQYAMSTRTTSLRTLGYELTSLDESLQEVRDATEKLSEMPLLVLTQGDPAARSDSPGETRIKRYQVWKQLQEDLTRLSRRSRWIIAEGSGHNIHLDQPSLLVRSVRQLVEEARLP